MDRIYTRRQSVIAFLLIFVLLFSVNINIAVPHTAVHSETPMAQLQTADKTVSAENKNLQPQTVQLSADASAQNDDTPKTDEKSPITDTSVLSDDILEDTKENITETQGGYEEKEGVTVIPATLNNTMRDSLPSIISTKIYTFSVEARGAVIYAFNHTELTESSCLWYITLYEEYSPDGTENSVEYRVLNRATYENIGVGVKSAAIGVMPGNYRIAVECVSGYTDLKYDMAIGFAETSFYEAEPNNTQTRYNELPLGRTINGAASVLPGGEADTDNYMFRITEKGYTVLYFEHDNDAENVKDNIAWRITLTDAYGKEYFYTSSSMEAASINSGIMGLPEGYYFVSVGSHIYSNVSYSLNVSFTKDSATEAELNETPDTADPIAINTEKIGSLTSRFSAADRDYFSFTMENDGFVVINFIHEALAEEKDGWNISVIDKKGKTVFSTVSDWNVATLQSPNIGLPAGDYFIRIDSDNIYHNSMVYRLILLTVQNTNWETEPNNSPADADSIVFGEAINGTMIETGVDYDRDWFAFAIEEEKDIKVSFDHIKSQEADKEGWHISILDESGNIIATKASDWNDDEVIIRHKLHAGKYYVLIETGLYFNSDRYILTVTNE